MFLTRSLSIKTDEKGFVYKCKLILRNLITRSLKNQSWIIFLQNGFKYRVFATSFEEMSPPELSKCLQKFYLSARKRDGSFYNKKSLTWLFGRLVVSVLCARKNVAIVAGIYESKSIVCGVYYLTVLQYTKTIMSLSVVA